MRRKGGVPPIVTVLVTIASIVGASLVAWFLYVSTRGAVNQPVFEVLSAYAIAGSGGGRTLSITVKYLSGPSSVTISSPSVTVTPLTGSASCSPTSSPVNPSTVSSGQSFTVTATCSLTGATSLDGASGVLEFNVGSSRIMLGFRVVEP